VASPEAQTTDGLRPATNDLVVGTRRSFSEPLTPGF
jgi:hypothetical protein